MPPTYGILLLTLFSITAVMHAALCPIYGPVFPPAKDLVDSPASRDAVTHIDAALDDALASGKSIHGPVSFDETVSIQIFDKEGAVFEHYNEGVDVAGGESDGREVNGGPVYRVGSVSKLYAVYLLLVVAGDHVFSDPAVKYLPEWEGVAYWDDVSGGALAGQIGVVADLYDVDSIAGGGLGAQFPRAFPELSEDENSPSVAKAGIQLSFRYRRQVELQSPSRYWRQVGRQLSFRYCRQVELQTRFSYPIHLVHNSSCQFLSGNGLSHGHGHVLQHTKAKSQSEQCWTQWSAIVAGQPDRLPHSRWLDPSERQHYCLDELDCRDRCRGADEGDVRLPALMSSAV
ncbi:hypothetical protein DPSP01_001369 [Paraphaeosphaeria sporulosa]